MLSPSQQPRHLCIMSSNNNNEKGSNESSLNKSKSILSELTVDSSTFTFIEYFLRLNLHASTAKIIQAYEVSNPQLTLQFEKRSKVMNHYLIICDLNFYFY